MQESEILQKQILAVNGLGGVGDVVGWEMEQAKVDGLSDPGHGSR